MTGYRFLLLLKPEANRPQVNRPGLLRLIFDHCERLDVEVLAQAGFSGHLLRGRHALDYLYPRLSVVAQMGGAALTSAERELLAREIPNAVSISADHACAEFMRSGSDLCADGDRARVIKLGPGAYAAHIVERNCTVLNHFFPEFRDRYYSDDATVIALECQTAGSELQQIRESLVGHIHPSRAQAGSLRASALAQAAELGLGEVSVARNFFHISPGYIEAMYQLAFFFPAGGSFQSRLVRDGASLNGKQFEAFVDRAGLAQIFAESEQMHLCRALRVVERSIDGCME